MKSTLELNELTLSLLGQQLLSIDLNIEGGEIATVMGASGAGKSSLLAAIAGFIDPAFAMTGSIRLNGKEIGDKPAEKRRVGLLFQDALLYPHLSVGGNLLFGLPSDAGENTTERKAIAVEALRSIGMADFFDRDPATLSGGQQSRVALMRLLLSQPQAVLLDEPFTNLDAKLKNEMRDFVFTTLKEAKIPTLLVTHDRQDAESAGSQIFDL